MTRDDVVKDLTERLVSEGLINAEVAASQFADFRAGKPCCAATVYSWMHKGHRLRDGRTVKLEHLRVGGKLCTSKPAILRFIRAQQVQPKQEVAVGA